MITNDIIYYEGINVVEIVNFFFNFQKKEFLPSIKQKKKFLSNT